MTKFYPGLVKFCPECHERRVFKEVPLVEGAKWTFEFRTKCSQCGYSYQDSVKYLKLPEEQGNV